MSQGPSRVRVEECWMQGGRLKAEVHEGGALLRLRGNAAGYVGLARVLLWLAHNGLGENQVVDLSVFDAFEAGQPRVELAAPAP